MQLFSWRVTLSIWSREEDPGSLGLKGGNRLHVPTTRILTHVNKNNFVDGNVNKLHQKIQTKVSFSHKFQSHTSKKDKQEEFPCLVALQINLSWNHISKLGKQQECVNINKLNMNKRLMDKN